MTLQEKIDALLRIQEAATEAVANRATGYYSEVEDLVKVRNALQKSIVAELEQPKE